MMTPKEELMDKKFSIIAFIFLLLMMYTMQSALCTINTDYCTFANGDWFNWLAPKVRSIEDWFWKVFTPALPG